MACTAAFKRMRALVTSDAILAYPDHNLPFDIKTDASASDFQLGAIIKQKQCPAWLLHTTLENFSETATATNTSTSFIVRDFEELSPLLITHPEVQLRYHQKRTPQHCRNPTRVQNCVSLLGAQLRIYMDHHNLTHSLTSFTTQQVMRWRLLLKEYGPTFICLPGNQNTISHRCSFYPTDSTAVITYNNQTTFQQFRYFHGQRPRGDAW